MTATGSPSTPGSILAEIRDVERRMRNTQRLIAESAHQMHLLRLEREALYDQLHRDHRWESVS